MDIKRFVVDVLRENPEGMTARQVLEAIHKMEVWTTTSKTDQRTLDARLSEVVKSLKYPIVKQKLPDGSTRFYFAPDKAHRVERSRAPDVVIDTEAIQMTIHPKWSASGRVDSTILGRAILSFTDAVHKFGRMARGAGGRANSNYDLDVIAPLSAGSFGVAFAPKNGGRRAGNKECSCSDGIPRGYLRQATNGARTHCRAAKVCR